MPQCSVVKSAKPLSDIVADLRVRHLLGDARTIAQRHGVTLAEMLGRRRQGPAVRARHELWSLAYEQLRSAPLLGDIFDRDYTTILAGVRAHKSATPGELSAGRECFPLART